MRGLCMLIPLDLNWCSHRTKPYSSSKTCAVSSFTLPLVEEKNVLPKRDGFPSHFTRAQYRLCCVMSLGTSFLGFRSKRLKKNEK